MAAPRPLLLLLLVCLLLSANGAVAAREHPVRVQLFMETLCPYCANATINQVAPIVRHPVLGQAITLNYVPWGNAVFPDQTPTTPTPTIKDNLATDAKTITCQHKFTECELNTLLSCSIALYPPTWFEFAVCLEETVLAKGNLTTAAVAEKCAAATTPPQSAARLVGCAEGALGRALTRMAGERTAALVPKHDFVPWFVLNGVPLRSAADQLLAFVCVALDPKRRALAADVCGDPVVEDDPDVEEEGRQGGAAAGDGRTKEPKSGGIARFEGRRSGAEAETEAGGGSGADVRWASGATVAVR